MTAAQSFNGSSGSSPPELNSDIFGTDGPDPLAKTLEPAKASAGSLAQVLVDCAAEAEAWACGYPMCEYVLRALRRGVDWELGQLDWMRT
jgi:hypothetical protein